MVKGFAPYRPIFAVMNSSGYRNIIIFVVVALTCGWAGIFVDGVLGEPEGTESPGMALWLVIPLVATLLLRTFAGDGWSDMRLKPLLRRNIGWYIVSIGVFPAVTLLTLLGGAAVGWVSFAGFDAYNYFSVFINLFAVGYLKNIFEEFVWRGYLTEKLLNLQISNTWLYVFTGGVWGLWHLPYYLHFLPEADMLRVLPVNQVVFASIAIVTMVCWSVLYVELYRLTRSIWPVVILHTAEDSIVNHLVLDGHISIVEGKEILVSPIVGIIATMLYLTVGICLKKLRQKQDGAQ